MEYHALDLFLMARSSGLSFRFSRSSLPAPSRSTSGSRRCWLARGRALASSRSSAAFCAASAPFCSASSWFWSTRTTSDSYDSCSWSRNLSLFPASLSFSSFRLGVGLANSASVSAEEL